MKKVILVFGILFLFIQLTSAQTDAIITNETVFDVVEEMPEFPGGTAEIYQFIGNHFIYPDTCRQLNIQGKIYISFIIEKDGSIHEYKILRGVHPLLDAEAIRVVLAMPRWKPGKQNGKAVRVRYNLPINCKLS